MVLYVFIPVLSKYINMKVQFIDKASNYNLNYINIYKIIKVDIAHLVNKWLYVSCVFLLDDIMPIHIRI